MSALWPDIPRLWVFTHDGVLPQRVVEQWPALVEAAGPTGLGLVLRYRTLDGPGWLALVRRLVQSAGPVGRVLVSQRVDVALAGDAHGVALPDHGLPTAWVRQRLPATMRLLQTVHNAQGLVRARHADAAVVSPVWVPNSHVGCRAPLGPAGLGALVRASPRPVLALGGVNPQRAAAALRAGAAGVAVVSAVWDAPSPAKAVTDLAGVLARPPSSG